MSPKEAIQKMRQYVHDHESVDGSTEGHGGKLESCEFASCLDLKEIAEEAEL